VHLEPVVNSITRPSQPFRPDRRDALSYLGGAAAR
jgi:hypothetical protein